jgi:hypothetical protein
MSPSELPQRASKAVAERLASSATNRRSFLVKAAAAGSAFMVGPVRFLLYPSSAWAANCPAPGGCTTGSCTDGYSAFCCGLSGGSNNCPSGTSPGGWWYACLPTTYCSTGHRYYIDCMGNCPGDCSACQCKSNDCSQRRVCCNHGYTNCGGSSSAILRCRIVRCVNPCTLFAQCACGNAPVDQNTCSHAATSCGISAPPAGSCGSC